MSIDVATVSPETSVQDVAKKLLSHRVSALPVVDDQGRLLGIVSEGDLMRRQESGTERRTSWWLRMLQNPNAMAADYVKVHGRCARDVMTKDVISVSESTSVSDIAEILEKHHIKRVPVVHNGKVVGIVSRANLLHGLIVRKVPVTSKAGEKDLRKAVLAAIRETDLHFLIDAVVSDGVVHLWGAVETEAERKALELAAENTAGVDSVVNHIGVYPQIAGGTAV